MFKLQQGWRRRLKVIASILAVGVMSNVALADPAPVAGGIAQARSAIAERKAVFTLLEANFKPVAAVAKGSTPFDAAQIQQLTERLAFLAGLLHEGWPANSNRGTPDTNALPEVWEDAEEFKELVQQFQQNVQALAQAGTKGEADLNGFKRAVAVVAQDCKKCHDDFKAN